MPLTKRSKQIVIIMSVIAFLNPFISRLIPGFSELGYPALIAVALLEGLGIGLVVLAVFRLIDKNKTAS